MAALPSGDWPGNGAIEGPQESIVREPRVRRGGERPPLRDGAAARELVLGWTSAFNRRDADALVALADAEIAYYPTILARGPRVYRGHEGLRAWLADLARAKAHHTVAVADVRVSPGGQLLVFGQIVEDDEPISPFSMLMRARRRLVIEAHVYLSDEAMMQTLGRVD